MTFPSRRNIRSAVLLLALLFPWAPARPQSESAPSAPLASIKVTGSARFPSEKIAAATGLHSGDNITRDDLQAAANRLIQLGLFATVNYTFSTVEAGVQVEYQVADAPTLPVWFDDFPWFTDAELTAALEKSVGLFDGTAPAHGTILDQISTALENLLAARGVTAGISHSVVTLPATDQQVQLFRTDSTDVNVAGVEFSDALAGSDPGIKDRLSDLIGKPFSRASTELFLIEQVRPVYLAHGYLRVQFGAPSARFAAAAAGSPPGVVVSVPFTPGPSYAWNGATWSGNSTISSDVLNALVPLKHGDPADGMKIAAAWQTVSDAYARLGYLDVDLKPAPQFDDFSNRVTYAVAVTEGTQYRMGNLVLTGLSIDGEQRIRAAWKIPPGAIFDKSMYDDFLASGIKMAFIGMPFHYEKIGRFLQEDPKTGKVDVLLDFQ
ncbi:MAG: POTRA domain-containing protein [Candidatus Acidiferrales bacterium]